MPAAELAHARELGHLGRRVAALASHDDPAEAGDLTPGVAMHPVVIGLLDEGGAGPLEDRSACTARGACERLRARLVLLGPARGAGEHEGYPAANTAPAPVPGGEPFGHTIHVSALQAARAEGQQPTGAAAVGAHATVASQAPVAAPATDVAPAQAWASPTPTPVVHRGLLTVLATGERVWIEGALFRIGRRRARVDLAVAGDTVSKVHATIHQQDPETWSIIDNGSTNGVEIDDLRIDPLVPVVLRPGQRIRIGDQVLVFDVAAV